jgi:hypothetical protein
MLGAERHPARRLPLSSVSPAEASSWPDDLDSVIHVVAATTVPLLLQPRSWINRKVETIEFVHDRRVRRHVSVDFTLPDLEGLPVTAASGQSIAFVPLAQLRKQVLRSFDIVDEAGVAVPMLTAEQNERIARELLRQLAGDALAPAWPRRKVLDRLDRIAGTDAIDALAALKEVEAAAAPVEGLPDLDFAALWANAVARPLMQDLAEHFVLFVAIDARAGERRVLKFVYDGELTWANKAWRRQVEERLGLNPVVLHVLAPAIGATHSYHAEVPAPGDLVIAQARLLDSETANDLCAPDRTPDRAHLWTTSKKREQEGTIELELRVGARGLYGAAVWISVLATLLFGVGFVFRLAFSVHTRAEPAAAIVIVLPALFATYLWRPGEHPLVQRLVSGLRVMITAFAVLSFIAAAVLAVEVHTWFRLLVWIVAFVLSTAMSSVIVYGYVRSRRFVTET